MQTKTILMLGSCLGFLGVAAGAFGTHALEDLPQREQEIFGTAADYQIYHALALVLAGILGRLGYRTSAAAWSFLLGVVVFSGSLYLLVFTDARWLGAVTPVGGIAFLVGWLLLAFCVRRGDANAQDAAAS